MDLAMSVATGSAWLGNFATARGRASPLLDNELHYETLADRLSAICAARGHDPASLVDSLHVVSLRGQGADLLQLKARMESIPPGSYSAIILDAMYRFIPAGVSENDNAAVMTIYNTLDQVADRLRCAFVVIHHSSKGEQGHKAVTDVGSGAGSMSRAADTHLVIRPHEEPDYAVLEAAVRSFPPVKPLTIYYRHPCWEPSEVSPQVGTPKSSAERRQEKTDDETRARIMQALAGGRSLSVGQLRGQTGFGDTRVSRRAVATAS